MASLTDLPQAPLPSANLEDELQSFPQRIITRQPPQQAQWIRKLMSVKDDTLNPVLTPSALDKLKKYVPIGTWATFTTFKSWAFSIRPNIPPPIPESNCNVDQHDVLIAVLTISFISAFSSVFVSRFKYDSTGKYVLYPPPQGFTVPDRITDPYMDVTFPCKTKAGQYFWPVFDNFGNFVHDETRGLKVLLLKEGAPIEIGNHYYWYTFHFIQGKNMSKLVNEEAPSIVNMIHGNAVVPLPSRQLKPYWRRSMLGVIGARYYLDLHGSVWGHALLSVLAFGTLSLFSPDVSKCLYPTVPDYILSAIQTGLLLLIGGITTFIMKDDTVEISNYLTQQFAVVAGDEDASEDIPLDLRAVVECVAWVKRVPTASVEAR